MVKISFWLWLRIWITSIISSESMNLYSLTSVCFQLSNWRNTSFPNFCLFVLQKDLHPSTNMNKWWSCSVVLKTWRCFTLVISIVSQTCWLEWSRTAAPNKGEFFSVNRTTSNNTGSRKQHNSRSFFYCFQISKRVKFVSLKVLNLIHITNLSKSKFRFKL